MKSTWDNCFPDKSEYGAFYQSYIALLDRDRPVNIIDTLADQMHKIHPAITKLNREQALHRYAEEKWTVKEVFGHLIDTERVFAYRALCFSRNDLHELPGFDQDAYVESADFNSRSLQSLGDEYIALRKSDIQLFSSFPEEALLRTGTANNNTMTVRSIPFIIAGHERHHLVLLKDRYKISI